MYDKSKVVVIGFGVDRNTRASHVANTAFVMALSGIPRSWTQPEEFKVLHNVTSALAMCMLLLGLIQQLETKGVLIKASFTIKG